ncbi:MAG: PDZ domain-containing protein [bacterium]|nr:PDZ domain-containing protein [bacterium]
MIAEILTLIEASYVTKQDPNILTNKAISTIIESLNDDFTQLLSQKEYNNLLLETAGEFVGVGIQYEIKKSSAIIIKVIKNSPAEKSGILAGDIIIKINNSSIKTANDLRNIPFKIRGPENSKVILTVLRNTKYKKFKIKRKKIKISSIEFKKINNLGYLKIHEFTDKTSLEFDNAMQTMDIKKLIIDLRNNPGGLIKPAIDIIKNFASKEKNILIIKGRKEKIEKIYQANKEAKYLLTLPLIILVNKYTISSAEIVAASLQSLGLAIIIGEQTFGKASIQMLHPLSDGRALALTTAKYYTPNGNCIHKKGLEPDISLNFEANLILKYAIKYAELQR